MAGAPIGSFAPAGSGPWRTRASREIRFRAIGPCDESALIRFHRSLSDRTVYLRYFRFFELSARTGHERLLSICNPNPTRELVLAAVTRGLEPALLAIGRMVLLEEVLLEEPGAAEFAILVADDAQGQGIGSEMLRRLVLAARAAGLAELTGEILVENVAMQRICRSAGFQLRPLDAGAVAATLRLEPAPPQAPPQHSP